MLPAPHTKLINEIQALLYEFIWKGKGERIARNTLIGDYNQGGFRMPDLVTQIRAIKATWVVRAQEIEGNLRRKT